MYSGLVRDPKVTERLNIHRWKIGDCNMPSVEELMAHFMPGQHVVQTYEIDPKIPHLHKTKPIPKED
jgi:hypothetical protein